MIIYKEFQKFVEVVECTIIKAGKTRLLKKNCAAFLEQPEALILFHQSGFWIKIG